MTKPKFKEGDLVTITTKSLVKHSRSIPAHIGFPQTTIDWRKKLSEHKGQTAVVRTVFPSGNLDIEFDDGYYVQVKDYMPEKIVPKRKKTMAKKKTAKKRTTKKRATKKRPAKKRAKKTKTKKLVPVSGYAYKLDQKGTTSKWDAAKDDYWDIEVYSPTGRETLLGSRWIDGAEVFVFKSGSTIVAQSAVNVRAGK